MTFLLDTDLLSLDRLDPGHDHRMQLDPDAWTRALRASEDAAAGRSFTYDTSRDSINYRADSAGPTSITIHWWGTPAYYRSGSPEGTLAWLTGITGNRGSSAHYVATVLTSTRQSIVYQIINDSDAAWHAGVTDANYNSLGIEMMPWDASTPAWQRDALLELAAELVASLWHRWPGLRNKPLKGHSDWYATECPGSYYPRLGDIYRRAQQLYPRYAGAFGQFEAPSEKEIDVTQDEIRRVVEAVWAAEVGRGTNRRSMASLLYQAAHPWAQAFGRGVNRRTAGELLAGIAQGVGGLLARVPGMGAAAKTLTGVTSDPSPNETEAGVTVTIPDDEGADQ